MTKRLLHMAPIVLIGLVTTEAPTARAAWSGSIGRNITAAAPEGTPLVLECQRGGEAAAVLALAAAALAAVAAVPGPVPAEAISVAAT